MPCDGQFGVVPVERLHSGLDRVDDHIEQLAGGGTPDAERTLVLPDGVGKAAAGGTLSAQEQSILTSYQNYQAQQALPGNTINAINSNQTLTPAQSTWWNSQMSGANGNYASVL